MKSPSISLSREQKKILKSRGMLSPKSIENEDEIRILSPESKSPNVSIKRESPKSIPHSVMGEELEEGSMEERITSAGLIPQAKIIIKDDVDPSAKYIKALTPDGNKVIIDLDEDDELVMTDDDIYVVTSDKATVVPYSTVVGSAECFATAGCSVAFECGDEMCVIDSEDGLNPRQTVLVKVNDDGTVSASDSTQAVLASPVVKFSDLVDNPESVKKSIEESTQIIVNNAFESCVQDLNNMIELSAVFQEKSRLLAGVIGMAFLNVASEIVKLKDMREEYDIESLSDDKEESEKLRKIGDNIVVRRRMLDDIISICGPIRGMNDKIKSNIDSLNSMIEFVDENFSETDKVYTSKTY